jgi:lysophospholipase L1-like esterase
MKTLVCFGDSITANEFDSEGRERLTPRIAKEMPDWKVVNSGISGNTTVDALLRIEEDVVNNYPDLVTVLLGANDSAIHRNVDIELYEENLRRITRTIGPKKTLLISAAPVVESRQDARKNETLQRFASVVEQVAADTGAHYLNFFEKMIGHQGYEDFLSEDGLHFNYKGYEFLSEAILKKIKSIKKVPRSL